MIREKRLTRHQSGKNIYTRVKLWVFSLQIKRLMRWIQKNYNSYSAIRFLKSVR